MGSSLMSGFYEYKQCGHEEYHICGGFYVCPKCINSSILQRVYRKMHYHSYAEYNEKKNQINQAPDFWTVAYDTKNRHGVRVRVGQLPMEFADQEVAERFADLMNGEETDEFYSNDEND